MASITVALLQECSDHVGKERVFTLKEDGEKLLTFVCYQFVSRVTSSTPNFQSNFPCSVQTVDESRESESLQQGCSTFVLR